MNAHEAAEALRAAGRAVGEVDVTEWEQTEALARLVEAVSELDARLSRLVTEFGARRGPGD